MTGKLLSMIGERFPIQEIDVGPYGTIKAKGMVFTARAFGAQGLGHISVMHARGFFGLMKMDTLIVNPKELDLPLYSYDRILAMGNDTLIIELYDTVVEDCPMDGIHGVNARYRSLPERDPGQHWYDPIKLPESVSKKGKKLSAQFDAYTVDFTIAAPEIGGTAAWSWPGRGSYAIRDILAQIGIDDVTCVDPFLGSFGDHVLLLR